MKIFSRGKKTKKEAAEGEFSPRACLRAKRSFFPKENRITIIVVFVIFCLYAVSLIYPVLWVLEQSLRQKRDFILNPLSFPSPVTFANYVNIFRQYNVLEMFFNSIVLTVGGVAASVLSTSIAAYTVSRFKFRGRNFIYGLVIFTMIIPTTGAMASTYRLMNDWGLSGSYLGLIIKGAGAFGFNFLLLYAYFKNISYTYSESAQLDGASQWTVFIRIMLPIALPSVTAVAIVSFIGHWNDYLNPYFYLRERPTLALGVYLLSSDITSGADSDYPALFAIMIVTIVPVIILFSIFQKKIIANTVAGGIKG